MPKQRSKPWGLFATLGFSFGIIILFVFVQTVVSLLCLLVQMTLMPGVSFETLLLDLESNGLVLAIATIVSAPICTAFIVGLAKLRPTWTVKAYLGLRRPTSSQLVQWSLITVVMMFGLDYIKALIPREETTFTTDVYQSAAQFLPLLYVAVVVMAPIFEEVFFRGFMFRGLHASRLGAIGAIILPALLWAAIHVQYDIYDMAGLFIFGVLLGIAQLQTGSLYVAIAMHALNNLIAMLQAGQALAG